VISPVLIEHDDITISQAEDGTLDEPGYVDALFDIQVETPLIGVFLPVRFRFFFRPEEYRLASEHVDDARLVEVRDIHQRDKEPGVRIGEDRVVHVAVEIDVDGIPRGPAGAPEFERQMPL